MCWKESMIAVIKESQEWNIFRAIRCFAWEDFLKFYEYYHNGLNHEAREFQEIIDKKGNTPLHRLCSIGSVPKFVLEKVLQILFSHGAISDVIGMQNDFGDTPLHIICRTSQRSKGNLTFLLRYCNKSNALTTQNVEGQTPLHVAASSKAWFPVIHELVRADPSPLLMQDNLGFIPAIALWNSTLSNVVVRFEIFDENRDVSDLPIFKKFWEKMKFLLLQTYKVDGHLTTKNYLCDSDDSNSSKQEILHAIFRYVCYETDKLFFAVRWDKSILYDSFDKYGNLPIHILVSKNMCKLNEMNNDASFHMKYRLLRHCLLQNTEAAGTTDGEGRLLLHRLIENCPPSTSYVFDDWSELIHYTLYAAPKALGTRDVKTRFYPFMCAAMEGSIDQTFMLLIEKPEILQFFSYTNQKHNNFKEILCCAS